MPNPSFSTQLPSLQLWIDSTSLTEFKICPRKYQLSILLGKQPFAESVHLRFGLLMHSAIELYHHRRLHHQMQYHHPDKIHEEALRDVVRWILNETWDKQLNRPLAILSEDRYKNRFTLIRTLIWYLDSYKNDMLETIILPVSGKPAVELSFEFESGFRSNFTGEQFWLCGHLDRLVAFKNEYYVTDVKTTKSTIGQYYFQKFNPDNQFSLYALAGMETYQTEVAGIIVDACQVAIEFSRFERGFVIRTPDQINEWQEDLGRWLALMEEYAIQEYWPKNDTACDRYGGCPFRPVCSQPNRGAAQQLLEASYRDREWNPRQKRGDI